MRRVVYGLILLALVASAAGCGPELKQEDLGEIQTQAAQLPGVEEKYALPKPLYEPSGQTSETEASPEAATNSAAAAPSKTTAPPETTPPSKATAPSETAPSSASPNS